MTVQTAPPTIATRTLTLAQAIAIDANLAQVAAIEPVYVDPTDPLAHQVVRVHFVDGRWLDLEITDASPGWPEPDDESGGPA